MPDGMWGRFLHWMGFEEMDPERQENANEGRQSQQHRPEERQWKREQAAAAQPASATSQPELVSLPGGGGSYRMLVVKPKTFDEVQGIADHLKAQRPVILNVETVDPEMAQRLFDFLSGAAYALDAELEKLSQHIFLVAPRNVEISVDDHHQEEPT